MATHTNTVENKLMEVIPLHFDVPKHQMSLQEFIEFAKDTTSIIDNFNEEFFEGKLKYKIYVVPPKDGGFIELLGITVAFVVGSAWVFVESDIGKAFIEELTGHTTEYWAKRAAVETKNIYANLADSANHSQRILEQKKLASLVLAKSTINFLKKRNQRSQKNWLHQ